MILFFTGADDLEDTIPDKGRLYDEVQRNKILPAIHKREEAMTMSQAPKGSYDVWCRKRSQGLSLRLRRHCASSNPATHRQTPQRLSQTAGTPISWTKDSGSVTTDCHNLSRTPLDADKLLDLLRSSLSAGPCLDEERDLLPWSLKCNSRSRFQLS